MTAIRFLLILTGASSAVMVPPGAARQGIRLQSLIAGRSLRAGRIAQRSLSAAAILTPADTPVMHGADTTRPERPVMDDAECTAAFAALMFADDEPTHNPVSLSPGSVLGTFDSMCFLAALPCSFGVAMSLLLDVSADNAMQSWSEVISASV